MRISDWSSDVCSSDLNDGNQGHALRLAVQDGRGAQCPDAAPRLFPSPQAARTAHLRAGAQALRRAGKMVDLGRNATEKDWRRSEERRDGKEGVSTCRSRWSPYH